MTISTPKWLQAGGLSYCLILTCGMLLQSCGGGGGVAMDVGERQPYVIPDSLLRTLKIDTVRQDELINSMTLTGQVDFDQDKEVNIFPLISGNINAIKVQLGDYVRSGEVLATVRSSEMAGYSNNLIVAQTNLTAMKKQLDATQDLYKSGLASVLDLTTAQTNYDQAVAQLDLAKRVLKINGNDTSGVFSVKSPIDGFMVQKFVTNDQVLRPDNGGVMFTISDLKDVWVWANVYEANLDKIHIGDPVDITTLSYPGRTFKGKVDKIMHVLDPNSKVMRVRVVIDNPDYALRPQMFATVTATNSAHQKAIFVPLSALVFDHSQYYVMTYQGSGKASITPVNKLSQLGDKVYLVDGVKAGDQIIASDALQIYDQLNN
ncbi:efflux RND transporter periplasmic adaptor subunit [Dinghuibacter silviterrae]|uniref:Cobalt-zinc-cadmium efflux system membrane fusion protein n=1 Tax=Dinghuibacter silviterrae TaxID=1539049 RepID=A0A4V6Q9Y3_9BACT|nr:efflux RND transporter periplasmic adaptor subunit [Dinghuibacter silviterrae]TDW99452.1 cobalt-zinc-cadmium efflux system membrane fusion protein [Dinghuibacter silviterrae]